MTTDRRIRAQLIASQALTPTDRPSNFIGRIQACSDAVQARRREVPDATRRAILILERAHNRPQA